MRHLFLILTVFAFCACSSSPNNQTDNKAKEEANDQAESTILNEGDMAPDFTFTTLDGTETKLSDLKGKTVFINFFAQACPLCIKELPVLQTEIYDKYRDREDFVLVIIGREHTSDELKQFVIKFDIHMPTAPDVDRSKYALFATKYIPRNILINKEGEIVMHKVGYSEDEFKEVIKIVDNELK